MVSWTDVVKDAPTGGDFLTKDDKERMYVGQIAFAIIGARPKVDTTFGDQTHYIVRLADDKTTDRTLAFSHNSYREGTAQAAQTIIDAGNGPVGPCYLRKFKTKIGNEAWEISGEPLENKPAASAAAPAVVDADLPF
jgi:hypothetical protein